MKYKINNSTSEMVRDSKKRREFLLENFLIKGVVVSFSLNIPGEVQRAEHRIKFLNKMYFKYIDFIESKADIVDVLFIEDKAGYIYYISVENISAVELKKLSLQFEYKTKDHSKLIDIDVYNKTNIKIRRKTIGYPERSCFVCDKTFNFCVENNNHDLKTWEEYADNLINTKVNFVLSEKYILNDLIESIWNGDYVEGERLIESKIAKHYDVSRTIIRSVISKLHQTELIVMKKNSGAYIKTFTLDEIVDIVELRIMIEKIIYKDVINNLNDLEKIIIKNMLDSMSKVDTTNVEDILLWNDKFNNIINSLSKREFTKKIFLNANILFAYIKNKVDKTDKYNRTRISFEEHIKLCEAFLTGDESELLEALNKHLNNSRRNIIVLFKKLNQN